MQNRGGANFEQIKKIKVKDNPIFTKVCMQFYFKNPKPGEDYSHLIFVKQDRILELDFTRDTDNISTLYQFQEQLNRQPEFFQLNMD